MWRLCFYKSRNVLLTAWIVALSLIPTAVFSQSAAQYVPSIQALDGSSLGIALTNPTSTYTEVLLTARDYAGELIQGDDIVNPVVLPLAAGSQVAQLSTEIFGLGISGRQGWIEISATSTTGPSPTGPAVTAPADVRGYSLYFDEPLSFIDGADFVRQAAHRLIYPRVSAGVHPTHVSIVNVSGNSHPVMLSLYDDNGSRVKTFSTVFEPHSGFAGPVSDLIPDIGGFEGYMIVEPGSVFITNPSVLIGSELYVDTTDIAVINAALPEDQRRSLQVPHMVTGGGYESTLVLVNPDAIEQVVRVSAEFLRANGVPRVPAQVSLDRTIAPLGRLLLTGKDFVDEDSKITGLIKIETLGTTNGVIAHLDYGSVGGGLTAVAAQSTSSSETIFAHVAQGGGYYTGLALVNPSTHTATVTVDVFDRSGVRVGGSALSLAPGERRAKLLNEFVPELGERLGGWIRVRASRPVFALQLFGSSAGLDFLASVASKGLVLQPQGSGGTVSSVTGTNVISTDGRVALAIPPTALMEDVPIEIEVLSGADFPNPTAESSVAAAIRASPTGTQFTVPVQLTFPLEAYRTPGSELPLLIFDGSTYSDSGFVAVVDESGLSAVAEVTHFTDYVAAVPMDEILTVHSVTPAAGVPGDTVTITGTGFGENPGSNIVTFTGIGNTVPPAVVVAEGPDQLVVLVPADAVTGPLIVTAGERTSNQVFFTVLPNDPPVPSIRSLEPPTSTLGTTSLGLEIVGTGFAVDSRVIYDGLPRSFSDYDSTLLLVGLIADDLTQGNHYVTVENSQGEISNVANFFVGPVGVTLVAGPAGGASRIAIAAGNDQSGVKGSPLPIPLTVKATDEFGNPVAGVRVVFTVGDGFGSIEPPAERFTGADGLVSTVATLGTLGVFQTFLATSSDLSGSPLIFQATAMPPSYGSVHYLEAESGTTTLPMTVQSDPDASNGQFVSSTTSNSGTVSFTLTLGAGTYVVWGRVLSRDPSSDSFFVSVDGGTEDVWDTSEGTWSND